MSFPDLLDPSLLGLLLLGIVTGILAAILGIGGGLLMVPSLTYWGATPIQAVATSLVGVFIGSASGTYQNWRMKQLDLTKVILLAPPAMLTTELGVWVANILPPRILLLSFAILQIVAVYLIDLKRKLQKSKPPQESRQVAIAHSMQRGEFSTRLSMSPSLSVSVSDTAAESNVGSDFQSSLYQTQSIGVMAGILSGLFGVGGGMVMVPLQMLFLEETIKDAVRTSLGAVLLISAWAVGRHALSGNVLWLAGICLGTGTLCGAQIGARLLCKLPDNTVSLLFRGLLFLMAGYMTFKAVTFSP